LTVSCFPSRLILSNQSTDLLKGEIGTMKKTITIIGGTDKDDYEKYAAQKGWNLFHHDGKQQQNPKKKLDKIIRNADCVVLVTRACHHETMYMAKQLAKVHNKRIIFHRGRGATGIFEEVCGSFQSVYEKYSNVI
jgi:hypothetical protein